MSQLGLPLLKPLPPLDAASQSGRLPPLAAMVNSEGAPREKGEWRRVRKWPEHAIVGILVCEHCKQPYPAKAYQIRRKQRFCCGGCRNHRTDEERFWLFVKKDGHPKCCWEWTGARVDDRYGNFVFHWKSMLAHRISWIISNGDLPDDIYVCHTCDNGLCVNPDHLFLGTQKDNMDDMYSKGRGFFQKKQ